MVAVTAIGLLSDASAGAAPPPPSNVDELADRFEELRKLVRIPGFSAAIARDDAVVWARGFGWANVEAQTPATPQTGYHLASLTKTFAATVIFQLVERGQLDLDAPVARYGVKLDGDQAEHVLVRHLMSHTSEGTPGEQFKYNGNRFALLDQVIKSAAGKSFGELVCQQLIAPLKLMHTAPNNQDRINFALAGRDRAAFEAALATPYELDNKLQLRRIEYPPHFSSSAGLISTASDVARHSIALDQGKLLSKSSLDRMFTPTKDLAGHDLPYGLGWFVLDVGGEKVVWHYGLWIGNSSLIIKVPQKRLTLVMLANSDRLSRMYGFGKGNLQSSPFARAFLDGFVTGKGELPTAALNDP